MHSRHCVRQFPSLRASRSRHCERSAAVHGPEFAVMDGRATLAMTAGIDGRDVLAMTAGIDGRDVLAMTSPSVAALRRLPSLRAKRGSP